MPLRRLDRQPLPGPQPRHVQLRGQRLDLPLHRLQADHPLQLRERLVQQHRIASARPGRAAAAPARTAVSLTEPVAGRRAAARPAAAVRARARPHGSRPSPSVPKQRRPAASGRPSTSCPIPAERRSPARSARLVVPVALGDRREPGRGVHERRVDPVHRPVQRQRGRAAPGALVGARQPVAQLLALRLLAAAAHQRGGRAAARPARTSPAGPGPSRRTGPASMPSSGSSTSGSVCRTSCSQSLTR